MSDHLPTDGLTVPPVTRESPTAKLLTIANVLSHVCEQNVTFDKEKSIFNSVATNKISIKDYMNRIHKYGPKNKDEVYLVVALVYVDKFLVSMDMRLNLFNVHRIWLVAYLLAIKFLDDDHYNNKWFASVGGIPLQELNDLEADFLHAIRFDLRLDTYGEYVQQLSIQSEKRNIRET